jgi:hypothetical protein
MRFLFDDDSFSFETLRTAGFALYGGADLGDVLVTAKSSSSWREHGPVPDVAAASAVVRRFVAVILFGGWLGRRGAGCGS